MRCENVDEVHRHGNARAEDVEGGGECGEELEVERSNEEDDKEENREDCGTRNTSDDKDGEDPEGSVCEKKINEPDRDGIHVVGFERGNHP